MYHRLPHKNYADSSTETSSSSASLTVKYPYQFDKQIELELTINLLSLSTYTFQVRRMDIKKCIFRSHKTPKMIHLHDTDANISVYSMKQSTFSSHETMQIIYPSTNKVAYTIRNNDKNLNGNQSMQIWKGLIDGKADMNLETNFDNKSLKVSMNSKGNEKTRNIIATARTKKLCIGDRISGKKTYIIALQKNVDAALIVWLTAIIFEQWRSHEQSFKSINSNDLQSQPFFSYNLV